MVNGDQRNVLATAKPCWTWLCRTIFANQHLKGIRPYYFASFYRTLCHLIYASALDKIDKVIGTITHYISHLTYKIS